MIASLSTIERYLGLLQAFETEPAAFREVLHPDFEQTEFPNALNQAGQHSRGDELYQRMKVGKAILRSQTFAISNSVSQGAHTVVEAQWTGVMAVDAGPLKAGQTLKARFCMVFEWKDGLIHRQRNYDCFDAF